MSGHIVCALLNLRNFGVCNDLEATLFELLARESRDLRVFNRHNIRHQLNDSNVNAHVIVERSEFDTDCARTHDQHGFWQFLWNHGVKISPDQLAIWLNTWKRTRTRTSRNDDVLRFVSALAQRVLWLWRLW